MFTITYQRILLKKCKILFFAIYVLNSLQQNIELLPCTYICRSECLHIFISLYTLHNFTLFTLCSVTQSRNTPFLLLYNFLFVSKLHRFRLNLLLGQMDGQPRASNFLFDSVALKSFSKPHVHLPPSRFHSTQFELIIPALLYFTQ